jgi:DNA-binding Lrp family transcriptional regulator
MHKLDRYDLKILRILAEDGRITKSSLADAINLSVTPAWERVRKLEALGLIKGYRAQCSKVSRSWWKSPWPATPPRICGVSSSA